MKKILLSVIITAFVLLITPTTKIGDHGLENGHSYLYKIIK